MVDISGRYSSHSLWQACEWVEDARQEDHWEMCSEHAAGCHSTHWRRTRLLWNGSGTFPVVLRSTLLYHPIDNIRVMVIVWRLRGNIVRAALCWVVWHNVHSQQHTHMSSSYRSSRFGLSHWDPYAVHRGGRLELYYCNTAEWCWWDSSLICKINWFPSVLWHCWFGHMTCKNHPLYDL